MSKFHLLSILTLIFLFASCDKVPQAKFSIEPYHDDLTYTTSDTITFVNESENAASCVWDFGDGYSIAQNAGEERFFECKHVYAQAGEYEVTLTVLNAMEAKSAVSKHIRILGGGITPPSDDTTGQINPPTPPIDTTNNDNHIDPDKLEAAITIDRGWILSTATCPEGYPLNDSLIITNLFQGFIQVCETDDILKFKTTGYEYLNPGTNICSGTPETEICTGSWMLDAERYRLALQIPFLEDGNTIFCGIQHIDNTEIRISYEITLNDTGNPIRRTCYFTYIPAY